MIGNHVDEADVDGSRELKYRSIQVIQHGRVIQSRRMEKSDGEY
jgi:hypothetical protein